MAQYKENVRGSSTRSRVSPRLNASLEHKNSNKKTLGRSPRGLVVVKNDYKKVILRKREK